MKSLGLSLLTVRKLRNNSHLNPGFTIVELLVVIVVIGVLAAITVVSYTGLTNKAVLASLQSDLSNASTQLKMFQTINGNYPATISIDCTATPDTTTNKCLKLSPGNTITSLVNDYSVNNSTSPQTFNLTIKNTSSSTIAVITDSSKPAILTPAPLSPVADWIATPTGDHYGNYYDSVTKTWATVTRTTPKTIYDPATQHIYDVPAGKLAVNPRSDGKSGSEAVIEEGRTNYVTNSHGSTNDGSKWTAGWPLDVGGGASGSWAYSLVQGVYSPTAWRIQYTGGVGDNSNAAIFGPWSDVGTFAPGDSATASVYIKGSQSAGINQYLNIECFNASNTYLGLQQASATLSSTWSRVSVTWSPLPANTSRCEFVLFPSGLANGRSFDIAIDAAQLEKGSFATSYIPTTTTTVSRNADVVTVPTTNWNANQGTALVVNSRSSSLAQSGGYPASLWSWENTISHRLDLYHLNVGVGVFGFVESGATGGDARTTSQDVYHTWAGRWNSGQAIRTFVDGAAGAGTDSYTATTTLGTGYIGYSQALGAFANGPIQRAIIYSSALSDSDVTTVTNAIKNGS